MKMKHLIMGTAGHVDHGKTSLIKALTNIDCDTHKEEKERGITINLGFSHLDLPSGISIGIIDVPGHKDFINTMVGGASGIDFVLFTIAADSGIMPQTIEHLNIIKTLNVKKIVFALTKIDLVDDELADLAKLEILELIENTQYNNSPIIGVSSVTKEGLSLLINTIEKLIPEIEEKNDNGIFRLYPDRIFSVAGIGSIVTGSVLSGKISVGNELLLLPDEKKLKVKSIQRHGKNIDTAYAGDRAAINVSGIKPDDFERGMLISDKKIEPNKMVDAVISSFENSSKLKLWSTMLFHSGTFESQVKIHLLNKDSLKPGDEAIVQIHLEKPATLLNTDKFILRNTSGDKTIGGGIIIDNNPLHHRKRTDKLIKNLTLLTESIKNENNSAELIKIELKKEGNPLSIKELSEKINKTTEEIITISEKSKAIIFYDGNTKIIVTSEIEAKFSDIILSEITEFHKQNYLFDTGVTASYLYGKLNTSKNKILKEYIIYLLSKLTKAQEVKVVNKTYTLSNYKATINDKTQQEINWLENIFIEYDLMKPVMSDIEEKAKEKNISKSKINTYLRYLVSKNKLVAYQYDYIHKSVINKIIEQTITELNKKPEGINLSEFRQVTGCSKKIIPALINIMKDNKIIASRPDGTHTIIYLP